MSAAVAIGAGVALGIFSRISSDLPTPFPWIGNFGALWLAVAFVAGRGSRSARGGAIAGACALVVAAGIHYIPLRIARDGIGPHVFSFPLPAWMLIGIAIGTLLGAHGAAHARHDGGPSVRGVGLLAAAFGGEAIVLVLLRLPTASLVAVALEIAVAIALPAALLRTPARRRSAYAIGAFLIPFTIVGIGAMEGLIHRVYPGL